MLWFLAGGAGFIGAAAAWASFARNARPGAGALFLGGAHLLVAGWQGGALARALLERPGLPYVFGFVTAAPITPGVIAAGSVLVLAIVAAFNALSMDQRAQLRTALVSTLFAVNLGGAAALDLIRGDALGALSFGGGVGLSGALGQSLASAALVALFVAGSLAAWRRALASA